MIRLILLIVLPIVQPGPVVGADALKLPAKLECRRDKMIGLKPGTTAERITYEIPATVDFQPKPDGFQPTGEVVRVEMAATSAIMFCAPPGTYRIRAYCALEKSVAFAETQLVVEGDAPSPGPGPVPTPPLDPFAAELQSLFAADTGDPTGKLAAVKAFANLYRTAATLATDTGNTTAGEFLEAVSQVAKKKAPTGVLVSLRARLLKELQAGMPSDSDAPLDDTTRKAVAATFTRLAVALEAIK